MPDVLAFDWASRSCLACLAQFKLWKRFVQIQQLPGPHSHLQKFLSVTGIESMGEIFMRQGILNWLKQIGWQTVALAFLLGLGSFEGTAMDAVEVEKASPVGAGSGPIVQATPEKPPCTVLIKLLAGIFPEDRNIQEPETKLTAIIVGQRVRLRGEAISATGEKLNIVRTEWSIPGLKVRDWVANQEMGKVIPVTDADLQKPTIDFCWVEARGFTISCILTVRVKGQEKRYGSVAFFEVTGPVVQTTTQTVKVTVDQEHRPGLGYSLHFGSVFPGKPAGIRFTQTPATVSNGELAFLHLLVKETVLAKKPDGKSGKLEQSGLDRDPRTSSSNWAYPFEGAGKTEDAPGIPLDQFASGGFTRVEQQGAQFEMYTMFKPTGDGSIWVPLNKVVWEWKGEADYLDLEKKWKGSGTATPNPVSSPTTKHPEWVKHVD